MFATAEAFQDVITRLSVLRYTISSNSKRGKFDISRDAEDFFCKLLNITFNKNLVNLNSTKRSNFPAIDLADYDQRVAVQVTSTNSRQKIEDTLATFFSHQLDFSFDTLIVLILTNKKDYRPDFENRNIRLLIWDIDDLFHQIESVLQKPFGEIYLRKLEELTHDELPGVVRALSTPGSNLLARLETVSGHPPTTAKQFMDRIFNGSSPDEEARILNDIRGVFENLKNKTYISTRSVLTLAIQTAITSRELEMRFPTLQWEYLNQDSLISYPALAAQDMGFRERTSYEEKIRALEFLGYARRIEENPYFLFVSCYTKSLDCNFFFYLRQFLGHDRAKLKSVLVDLDFRILD